MVTCSPLNHITHYMHHMIIKNVCPDTLRDESLNKKILLHLFSAPHNSWDKALDYPEDGKYTYYIPYTMTGITKFCPKIMIHNYFFHSTPVKNVTKTSSE